MCLADGILAHCAAALQDALQAAASCLRALCSTSFWVSPRATFSARNRLHSRDRSQRCRSKSCVHQVLSYLWFLGDLAICMTVISFDFEFGPSTCANVL
jgi:hypothetical protein